VYKCVHVTLSRLAAIPFCSVIETVTKSKAVKQKPGKPGFCFFVLVAIWLIIPNVTSNF